MVTVAGCLGKGETMKKRKIMFAAVIVVFCLVIFVVTRQQTSRSILGTMKMYSVFQIPEVSLAPGKLFRQEIKKPVFSGQGSVISYSAKNKNLSKRKRSKIFAGGSWIVGYTDTVSLGQRHKKHSVLVRLSGR